MSHLIVNDHKIISIELFDFQTKIRTNVDIKILRFIANSQNILQELCTERKR